MTNILKYDISVDTQALIHNLRRITNQIYKLLPSREEGLDWQKPLETLIEELSGLDRLLLYDTPTFLTLLCKLEGLFILTQEEDFLLYRRTIFECLSLMNRIIQECQDYSI